MAILDEFLQDFVLESSYDTYDEPPIARAASSLAPPRQNGTLVGGMARPSTSVVVRRSRGMQTGDYVESCWIGKLPLEVVENIVLTATLSAMVEDDSIVSLVTIDCLRPEAGVQSTMDVYPQLTAKFNGMCKTLSLVCRLFRSICLPLLWREPYFSRDAQGFDSFLAMLPTTTSVRFSPALPPPRPFWTYVRSIAAFGSSLFHKDPTLLLKTLPHLQKLETLRFGASSADMPRDILEQISFVTPRSIKRLPDVLMHPKEGADEASRRLSAILSIASRCEELQMLDIIWGHALGNQLSHLLFALQLQAIQPTQVRPVGLTSLSFNEQCAVSLGFLEQLASVAPRLSSLHFEMGSRIVPTAGAKNKALDLTEFVKRLPCLESFSFTPTCEVPKSGNFDTLLRSHPKLKCLQLFINDFDSLAFFEALTELARPVLKCLCIATTTDNLSTLLVLRRPWRLRKMAPLVIQFVKLMPRVEDEQMRLDIIRKADLLTLPKGTGVNYN